MLVDYVLDRERLLLVRRPVLVGVSLLILLFLAALRNKVLLPPEDFEEPIDLILALSCYRL